MTHGPTGDLPLPGIVLAGGLGRRMGLMGGQPNQPAQPDICKLTLPLRGKPLLSWALQAALGGGLDPLIVVRGPHSPDFSPILHEALTSTDRQPRLELITAPDAALGQAHSLKAGLSRLLELAPESDGVMFLLGDQPLIGPNLVRELTAFFRKESASGPACAAPVHNGRRGHPVIIHAHLFPDLLTLTGDTGPRDLLATLPLALLSWPDDGCLADVDTPVALNKLRARMQDAP